jgi:hypothetical protein
MGKDVINKYEKDMYSLSQHILYTVSIYMYSIVCILRLIDRYCRCGCELLKYLGQETQRM